MIAGQPSPSDFFSRLVWLDGRPLLDTIEPYRRKILLDVLYTPGDDGWPQYNLALLGRAKKNSKTTDLLLAGLYRFIAWESAAGNDAFILANDEDQAGDDLALAKKLIYVNQSLAREIDVKAKELIRADERGTLKILPARDAIGAHGKTYVFLGFDEIHGYRNHDLFEALAPDPTRRDALVWMTSYAAIRSGPGIPISDFFEAGKRGDDPQMYFSWYSGDFTTDESVAEAPPEQRANPSMQSWGNSDYLAQQRRRLPTHKFRRMHLNLPGAPDGAFLDQGAVLAAIVTGRKAIRPDTARRYVGFVDMSGGSSDDATLGIAHRDSRGRAVLDLVERQAGKPPFNPRAAVTKFANVLHEYRIRQVVGDNYAGETFKADFDAEGISYRSCPLPKSQLYEAFEPRLNAGEIELLDLPKLQEQLLTLVIRGARIDHQPGDHDDWANAAAGAVWAAQKGASSLDGLITPEIINEVCSRGRYAALFANARHVWNGPAC